MDQKYFGEIKAREQAAQNGNSVRYKATDC